MFIGHYAAGFGAKRLAPRTSLGVLMGAALLLDLIWAVFLQFGWERIGVEPGRHSFTPFTFEYYPFSHSLLGAVFWAALLGGFYWAVARDRTGALVVALVGISHWPLDAIVHPPDLAIFPGGPKIGLGLWASFSGTFVLESILFAAGVWLYLTGTRGNDGIGRWGCWSFIGLAAAMFASNLFSPPPPDPRVFGLFALTAWLMPLWCGWFDRHRLPLHYK